jgi:NAD(P)-dependent dehydrogenase (short-subunit alcohol dehydrogenase family)
VVGIAGGALDEEPPTQDDPVLLDVKVFRASIEANLVSQFVVLRAALPWLRQSTATNRSVAFASSWNALTGVGMPAYSAAKAGLIGMMHALTSPLGAEGIRVNVVAPGTVRTPRTERIWAGVEGHFERLEATTATGRLGTPDDVARAFVALVTQLVHMTGQVLVVDGGQTVKRH